LPGDDFSYGFDVNDRGDVVGYSNDAGTGANTAVVWRKGKGRKKQAPGSGRHVTRWDIRVSHALGAC